MRQISGTTTRSAPVGGINAFDAISAMDSADAIALRNWFPTSYGCTMRRGYKKHAGNFNGLVQTGMVWKSNTGVETTFAIDQDGIYDISTIGDVSGTPDVALTEPVVQHTILGNTGGTNLIGFNGADDGLWYSNAGWKRLTAGDGIVDGTWSGVDPADLIQCTVHQKRLWAVEKDSAFGWYLPPNQIFGEAKNFDFGPVFSRGGFLQSLTTWTRDSGDGMDDYLIAISSVGQVAVYQGTDVDSADSWVLVGVYFIGATFSRKCFIKYGGDVVILTQYGLVSMEAVVGNPDASILSNTISVKIQTLISDLVTEGSFREGWDMIVYAPANMLILNIPGLNNSQNLQLALNTIKRAWSSFSGMAASSWFSTTDSLMFGSDGVVYRAWEGFRDDVDYDGSGGEDIVATGQQAFDFFENLGDQKHFKMVRPSFITAGNVEYNVAINTDYVFDQVDIPTNPTTTQFGLWDEAYWDEVVWSGGTSSLADWLSVEGIGFSASLVISVKASVEVTWVSTNWMLEKGGPV